MVSLLLRGGYAGVQCLGDLPQILQGFSGLLSSLHDVDRVDHANQVLGLVLLAHASATDNLLQSSFRLFHSGLGCFGTLGSPILRRKPGFAGNQEQKKPTWRDTRRYSTTSAYSSTSPPVGLGCSLSSHPTTLLESHDPLCHNSSNAIIVRRFGAKARGQPSCPAQSPREPTWIPSASSRWQSQPRLALGAHRSAGSPSDWESGDVSTRRRE